MACAGGRGGCVGRGSVWAQSAMMGEMDVEPFIPPPPQEGCACAVCQPKAVSDEKQALYDRHNRSPFVRFRIMKENNDGTRELNEQELQYLERHHPDLCEWNMPPKDPNIRWKKLCMSILNKLKKKRRQHVFFAEAVDPIKHGVPDYFNVIRHPMDLALVERYLKEGKIYSPEEFTALCRLVFRNCFTYNGEGNPACQAAEVMSRTFESELMKLWGTQI